ncbi:YbaB/EbfC family nucleoid-associated protein [Sphaerisporangium perillae]|uniref:YbaB/EbfC family nucleoid-associated protein n=1 Tax=Sphaerisporangium perillae TaxID=2935860 RepID=UPI00200C4C74|nr:YbaB/EbfC family nucleoid-associated protein [Sphaerisporangium perillae]
MSSPTPWADDLEHLERILRQTEEVMRDLGQAQAMIEQVAGEGEGADGLIQVVADGRGRLKTIGFDPRVMRLDPDALSREALRAIQAAQESAGQSTQEIIERAQADAARLAEPLDEQFVRRRVEQVAREIE